jgi:rhodanese-related sulfurtransferase
MSREALLEKMKADPALFIVDVRSQGEFDKDHIPGALHIPFYSIGSGLSNTGISKKDLLILYCEHGPRSGIASLTLFLSGYEQVYSLDGHMKGWRKSTFPIELISHGSSTLHD